MRTGKLKRIMAVVFCVVFGCGSLALTGCGGNDKFNIDSTKTQLYVYSYTGGVGDAYLNSVVKRFEETYADYEFEPGSGKKGVQILTQTDKTPVDTLLNGNFNVLMAEAVNYNSLASAGKFLDISDVVTTPLNEILEDKVSETGTIESKLYDAQKSYLKLGSTKYYGVPHYTFYSTITYNKKLFDANNFYFAKEVPSPIEETGDYFINNVNPTKSCGPDGTYNTSDDGLPATWDEFVLLCEYMKSSGVMPFTLYSAQNGGYFNYFLNAVYLNLSGKTQAEYNFTYDSGSNKIKIVSDTGVVSESEVNTNNYANVLNRQQTRLQTLEIAKKIVDSSKEYFSTNEVSLSRAQNSFATSVYSSKPCGMMIEGSYWYNEAASDNIFSDARGSHSDYDTKNEFCVMPLPRVYSGKASDIAEKVITKPVICDQADAFVFINANIKGNANLIKLSKMFLAFNYTDESLKEFTYLSRCAKNVIYDVDESKLDAYGKNSWNFFKNADFVNACSGNAIFLNNQENYSLHISKKFWTGKVKTSVWSSLRKSGDSAMDYFKDLAAR